MRIVHELHWDAQTTVSGSAYATKVSEPDKWPGMRIEALAAWIDKGSGQEEAIHIEGDLDKFRAMLRDWLAQLDLIEAEERERFAAEVAARSKPG